MAKKKAKLEKTCPVCEWAESDCTCADAARGLYDKYRVERKDGDPEDKHYECRYFVLDMTHDRYARIALLAYAGACEDEYPLLAKDLIEMCETKERT